MVASIRNISARGVTIGQNVAPPPDTGIQVKTTSGTMTYWSTYLADYPGIINITGSYDPTYLGSLGTLSNSNMTVKFTGTGSVLTTVPLGLDFACEFHIGVTYQVAVGFWSDVSGSPTPVPFPYDAEQAAGGNLGGGGQAAYYDSIGQRADYFGTSSAPTFGSGDIIGMVFRPFDGGPTYYKNGLQVAVSTGILNNFGWPMASRI